MFVIGTAGHVDHGKSTLVRALTGIDPDRLAVEKEREMTIDLGFAWLKLPSQREVGIIDVPGHEHFIKNMLAGVSGLDLVLLVVDANEGVMPQTREHLDILDLIAVKKGIAVITKADQADQDQITLAEMEIEELLDSTSLAGSPIVPVSALSGQGLNELVATIDNIIAGIEPLQDKGKPRLSIDRVFTISGSGTVVTGTLIDGSLSVGQEVEILPPAVRCRIRGLQTHKAQLRVAGPGSRVAANIVGANSAVLERGYVLTLPGWITPTSLVDARLQLLTWPERPLRHNMEVSFHTGSAEVMARVRLLEKEEIAPGGTAWVQFILNNPAVAVEGDHFIIRSPNHTLGGGVILDAHPVRRHRRSRPEIIELLKMRSEGKVEETLLAVLKTSQPLEPGILLSRSNLPAETTQAAIDFLIRQGKVVMAGTGKNAVLFTDTMWNSLKNNIIALVEDYHRKFPARPGIPGAEIGSRLKMSPFSATILQKLVVKGDLVGDMALIRLPTHQVKLSPAQQTSIDKYLEQLKQHPYSPSPEVELEPDLLNLLVERNQVVKTQGGVIFAKSAFDEMTNRIVDHLRNYGKITVAEVRDMFQSSRKYVMALLEYLDEKKITKRVGDERVLGVKG